MLHIIYKFTIYINNFSQNLNKSKQVYKVKFFKKRKKIFSTLNHLYIINMIIFFHIYFIYLFLHIYFLLK